MNPDLEVVQIGRAESFKAWEHGYPFRTVRWHFHPEFELHYVVSTSGRYFVGDFIGSFEPGNLVLTGPNLPHNWVSDTAPGEEVPLRSRVVQFTEGFITEAIAADARTRGLPRHDGAEPPRPALRRGDCRRASGRCSANSSRPQGIRRIELFLGVIGALARAADVEELTSAGYLPDPSGFMSAGINKALAYINDNLTEPFSETDLARIAGLSTGAFSRSFRRHTGLALVQYVNRLRINFACQLLMNDRTLRITDVCFAAGFNNLSNFNRQFLKQKGMTPSRFRALLADNFACGSADAAGECRTRASRRRWMPHGGRIEPSERDGTREFAAAWTPAKKRRNTHD